MVDALLEAFKRIKEYHEKQIPIEEKYTDERGVLLGWKWKPIKSVGIYVPGGKAVYPSSVLMNAIPALVAGSSRLAIAMPTPGGEVMPATLAAAKICGITEIYKMGGAQAVAALAYGTETVSPVNKIVGPGNAYVAEAKRQVFGKVGIDMIAGPSEILVVADETSNPKWIAADILSQAEHDEIARPILVCNSEDFANQVIDEIEIQLEKINKKDIALKSLQQNGYAFIVNSLALEAPDIINKIAPEHLEICLDEPETISTKVQNAGAIFLGKHTPEALGDYMAGPSHVLPTMGTAKFSSGLSVMDFLKRTSMVKCNAYSLNEMSDHLIKIAKAEKLDAHALSVSVRSKD